MLTSRFVQTNQILAFLLDKIKKYADLSGPGDNLKECFWRMGIIFMRRYSNDPRIINLKYPGSCKDCNCSLEKRERDIYRPLLKEVKCHDCAGQDYREFLASAADEDVYHGRGNPFY